MTNFDDSRSWPDFLRAQLFDRRVVSVSGDLDDALANRVAVELMTLDATGDQIVRMLLDSGGGTLEAALVVVDVIDLLGVPVHTTCVGRADGPALAVLAVSHLRAMTPHARLRLYEPESAFDGRGTEMAVWAEQRERQRRRFCERIAVAARCSPDRIATAMREGRYFDAHEALRLGFVDEIARANIASVHRFDSRPLGFQSGRP